MKSLFTEEPLVYIAIQEDGNADMMWNGVQTGNQQLSELWNRKGATSNYRSSGIARMAAK